MTSIRARLLTVLFASLVIFAPAWAECRGHGHGAGCGGCGGCGGGGGAGMAEARDTFHALLGHHESIRRTVEDVEGGVVTMTTSDKPEVAALLRTHVRQMEERVRQGAGLRHWDPLFVELFKHYDKIRMTIVDVEGGVRVTETSDDPQVTALIRQHARTVSEFAAEGFDRAHRESPLPEGYGVPATSAEPGSPPSRP